MYSPWSTSKTVNARFGDFYSRRSPTRSLRSPRTVPRWIGCAAVKCECDPVRDLSQAEEPRRVLLQLVPGILRGRPHRRRNMESPQVSPRGTSPPKPQCPHLDGGETGHLPEGVAPLRTAPTHHGHCLGLDAEGGGGVGRDAPGRVGSKSPNDTHKGHPPTCPTPLSPSPGPLLTPAHSSVNSLLCSISKLLDFVLAGSRDQ